MKFPESSCSCDACVSMCRKTPCWPTPDEAVRLMDAGYANRLLELKNARGSGIAVLHGGIDGAAREMRVESRGQCTFLQKDGKCELHDKGLKPLEGRVAVHGMNSSVSANVRSWILCLWDRHLDVIREWKEKTNVQGNR